VKQKNCINELEEDLSFEELSNAVGKFV